MGKRGHIYAPPPGLRAPPGDASVCILHLLLVPYGYCWETGLVKNKFSADPLPWFPHKSSPGVNYDPMFVELRGSRAHRDQTVVVCVHVPLVHPGPIVIDDPECDAGQRLGRHVTFHHDTLVAQVGKGWRTVDLWRV